MNLLHSLVLPVFPIRCRICGVPLVDNPFLFLRICGTCIKKLIGEKIHGPICSKCGMPLLSENNMCVSCRKKEHAFIRHFSLFMYQGMARTLIKAYKFDPLPPLSHLWAHMLAAEIRHFDVSPGVVVPVPARRSSVRTRGWDQMELICKVLHSKYGFPNANLLKRSASESQKKLTYEQRMRNLSGHINLRRSQQNPPPEILLLDDVYTTGATLNECARTIKQQAAVTINAVTIAMAPY